MIFNCKLLFFSSAHYASAAIGLIDCHIRIFKLIGMFILALLGHKKLEIKQLFAKFY